jgi:hypothetical protein
VPYKKVYQDKYGDDKSKKQPPAPCDIVVVQPGNNNEINYSVNDDRGSSDEQVVHAGLMVSETKI